MDKILQEITKRIIETVDPDKIYLFGSRTKKTQSDASDYDIFILKGGKYQKRELRKDLYSKLFGIGVSIDLIIETPEKFSELQEKSFLIHSRIAKHGKVVYEKS